MSVDEQKSQYNKQTKTVVENIISSNNNNDEQSLFHYSQAQSPLIVVGDAMNDESDISVGKHVEELHCPREIKIKEEVPTATESLQNCDDKFDEFFLFSISNNEFNSTSPFGWKCKHQIDDEDYCENSFQLFNSNNNIDQKQIKENSDSNSETEPDNDVSAFEQLTPKKPLRTKKGRLQKKGEKNIPADNSFGVISVEVLPQNQNEKKKRNLTRHTKDEIVRLFFCHVRGCGKSYGTSSALRIHLKRKHPLESEILFQTNKEGTLHQGKTEFVDPSLGVLASELLFSDTLEHADRAGDVISPFPFRSSLGSTPITIPLGTPLKPELEYFASESLKAYMRPNLFSFPFGQIGQSKGFVISLHSISIGGGKWKRESKTPKDLLMLLSPKTNSISIEVAFEQIFRVILRIDSICDWFIANETESTITFSVTFSSCPEFFQFASLQMNTATQQNGFICCSDFTENIASSFARHEYTCSFFLKHFFCELFRLCKTNDHKK